MATCRNNLILFAIFLLSATARAQQDDAPIPLNPVTPSPWVTPMPNQPGVPPNPTDPSAIPSPVMPSFGSFDEEEDEDWEDSGSASGGREGKSSFQLLEPGSSKTCGSWSHPLLGPTTFRDKMSCQFELDRKIDKGTTIAENILDQFERFKLQKQIRGQLSRSQAGNYAMNFGSLSKTLQKASKKGCTCQE